MMLHASPLTNDMMYIDNIFVRLSCQRSYFHGYANYILDKRTETNIENNTIPARNFLKSMTY